MFICQYLKIGGKFFTFGRLDAVPFVKLLDKPWLKQKKGYWTMVEIIGLRSLFVFQMLQKASPWFS